MKVVLQIGLALVFFLTIFTVEAEPIEEVPDTVKVGSYVISIHDINFREKEYTIRFWLWMLYKNKDFDFANRVEVPNAKSIEKPDVFIDTIGNKNWVLMKMKCVMKQAWKVTDFPFDKQRLMVKIENSEYDKSSLVFVPDTVGKYFDPSLEVDGWKIASITTRTATSAYETSFGDTRQTTPHSEYDSFEININLERNAWGLFLKLFTGMYIAFLIGFVSFYIHTDHIEASFGLQVGGLFAAVGNKYIIDSYLPETSSFTLVDTLHSITFVYLFLIILSTTIALIIYKKGKVHKYVRINKLSARVIAISYFVLNLLFVLSAIKDFGLFHY